MNIPRRRQSDIENVRDDIREIIDRGRGLIKKLDILGITDLVEERIKLPITAIEKMTEYIVKLDNTLIEIKNELTDIKKSLKRIEDKISKL